MSENKKIISPENYIEWLEVFDHSDSLRLGQSFCNYFNITDSTIFHETNNAQALMIIQRTYINF